MKSSYGSYETEINGQKVVVSPQNSMVTANEIGKMLRDEFGFTEYHKNAMVVVGKIREQIVTNLTFQVAVTPTEIIKNKTKGGKCRTR